MADEGESDGPSLEPPSLFRRKKKKSAEPAPVAPPVAPPPPTTAQVDDSPTTILDDVAPAEMTQPLAAPVPATPDAPPPLFADEVPVPVVAAAAASSDPSWSSPEPSGSPSASLDVAPTPEAAPVTAPVTTAPAPKRVRKERIVPVVPQRVAAAIAGLLVGAVIVGLTSASFELCNQVRGTDSCGGPGVFLLLAILAVAVLVGTAVLRVCKVGEPGSTSFLAVGLTSVVALLFLVDAIFDWWMIIVIPLVSVATFLLSHWVTQTFVEPPRD